MSVQSEINRISGNVASAYDAVEEMGGTLPESENSDNLATSIRSIPSGTVPKWLTVVDGKMCVIYNKED